MVSVTNIVVAIIFIGMIGYALMKEREELGCPHWMIGTKCNDMNSVYLKDTQRQETDTPQDMCNRLKSILSYHEKAGAWKRCVILTSLMTTWVWILHRVSPRFNTPYHYAMFFLLTLATVYFYHNFLNYHHFRRLKQNGVDMIEHIEKKL